MLIIQLFNLQIIHGAEYREESNTRLTRESTLEASRGQILDRTGTALVKSSTKFSLELYKTKIDNNELNDSILNIVNLLEKYEVNYNDTFPINTNPFEYTISDESLAKWKKTYNIEVDCANCAAKMEEAAQKTDGVREAVVSFMTQKMKVEFDDGADEAAVMKKVLKNCKRVEDDCEIYI